MVCPGKTNAGHHQSRTGAAGEEEGEGETRNEAGGERTEMMAGGGDKGSGISIGTLNTGGTGETISIGTLTIMGGTGETETKNVVEGTGEMISTGTKNGGGTGERTQSVVTGGEEEVGGKERNEEEEEGVGGDGKAGNVVHPGSETPIEETKEKTVRGDEGIVTVDHHQGEMEVAGDGGRERGIVGLVVGEMDGKKLIVVVVVVVVSVEHGGRKRVTQRVEEDGGEERAMKEMGGKKSTVVVVTVEHGGQGRVTQGVVDGTGGGTVHPIVELIMEHGDHNHKPKSLSEVEHLNNLFIV